MQQSDHILFAYSFGFDSFGLEGKATKLDNEKVSEELKNQVLSWVHLDANKEETKTWLDSEVNYLDHLIIDALVAEEARPRVVEFDSGGLLIILRGVNLNKNSQPEDMVSIRIWIDGERIITVQRRELGAVFDLRNQIDAGNLVIKNSGEFLYKLLYQILIVTAPFIYDLNEKIDAMEDKIMTTHDIKFREEILQIRTQSAIFKRYLMPQKEVISKLRNLERHWLNEWARRHFQENFDQIVRMTEEVEEATNRSQILHDELANALSEKLNKSMYKLSIIASIFMPLTFITGLFGMNIGGVPGVGEDYAFPISVAGMLLITLVQIFYFKRRDWF